MKNYFLVFIVLYSYATGQKTNERATKSNPQYYQPPANQQTNYQRAREPQPASSNRQPNSYYPNGSYKPPGGQQSYPPVEKSQNNEYRPKGTDQSSQIIQNVSKRDQPKYICSIQYDGNEECSCVITSTRTVVTAAHCVYEKNPNYYQVAVGFGFNKKYDVVSTNYKNFVYQYPYFDDIVELTVSNPIEISADTGIVQIPSKEECSKFPYGNRASIWSPSDENSPLISNEIQVTILNITDVGCLTYYLRKQITQNMFCAGWNDGRIDPCKADDGGPLIYNNKLYGIASWGKGCKRPTQASVYADFCKFNYDFTDREAEEYIDFVNSWDNYDDPFDN